MIVVYKVHPLLSCVCSPDLICMRLLDHERAAGEIFRTSTHQPRREDTLIEDEPQPDGALPLAQREAALGLWVPIVSR